MIPGIHVRGVLAALQPVAFVEHKIWHPPRNGALFALPFTIGVDGNHVVETDQLGDPVARYVEFPAVFEIEERGSIVHLLCGRVLIYRWQGRLVRYWSGCQSE